MYVVEACAGSTETMKITLISLAGTRWTIDVLPEYTIDKLKMMALSHFYNPMDSIKVADRYKLISVSDNRPLSDEGTLRDESVQNNDELLLLKRRFPPKATADNAKDKDEKDHGPTETEIQKYTANIIPKNLDYEPESIPLVDFHSELRKILVSLVETSEKMLRYHPDIVELFKEVSEEETSDSGSSVDSDALKQLTDMGFPEPKAIQALQINSNAVTAAEWLLTTGSGDSPSSPSACNSPNLSTAESSSASCLEQSSNHSPSKAGTSNSSSEGLATTPENPVARMLHYFRAYKRKVFKPNRLALSSLKEMGFAETDILDALRINGNNQDSACDWLLSDKKVSTEDVSKGLDPDGPIYKAIMDNAIVQLGLCNPKTFLALLHMLENPNSACRWLSDPDTAPILSQIFRIYHAEKHTLQLARPFML